MYALATWSQATHLGGFCGCSSEPRRFVASAGPCSPMVIPPTPTKLSKIQRCSQAASEPGSKAAGSSAQSLALQGAHGGEGMPSATTSPKQGSLAGADTHVSNEPPSDLQMSTRAQRKYAACHKRSRKLYSKQNGCDSERHIRGQRGSMQWQHFWQACSAYNSLPRMTDTTKTRADNSFVHLMRVASCRDAAPLLVALV